MASNASWTPPSALSCWEKRLEARRRHPALKEDLRSTEMPVDGYETRCHKLQMAFLGVYRSSKANRLPLRSLPSLQRRPKHRFWMHSGARKIRRRPSSGQRNLCGALKTSFYDILCHFESEIRWQAAFSDHQKQNLLQALGRNFVMGALQDMDGQSARHEPFKSDAGAFHRLLRPF